MDAPARVIVQLARDPDSDDHSIVKLTPIDSEPNSDYINANFIPGYSSLREFICTQGPLRSTTTDFWRMVWEQNVRSVVMLTLCKEHGKSSTHTERRVSHFYYTAWPDCGVPRTPASMTSFTEHVREQLNKSEGAGPTVVHCSAGVGRTGTFITLDWLLQQLKSGSAVDVPGIVHKLRSSRCLMVQTLTTMCREATENKRVPVHLYLYGTRQPTPPAQRWLSQGPDNQHLQPSAGCPRDQTTDTSSPALAVPGTRQSTPPAQRWLSQGPDNQHLQPSAGCPRDQTTNTSSPALAVPRTRQPTPPAQRWLSQGPDNQHLQPSAGCPRDQTINTSSPALAVPGTRQSTPPAQRWLSHGPDNTAAVRWGRHGSNLD
ncbi:UNVERIFIED_CONTAM: hypothetical protein FKN15_024553 [Acipenser sinensis]